ncbi:MAG: hypothetical protein ACE5J3_14115 [Methanosarcinales archaeon]
MILLFYFIVATLLIVPAAKKELIDHPIQSDFYLLVESAYRFKSAIEGDDAWIKIAKMPYPESQFSKIIDITRKRIANLDKKKEHKVKKADSEFIAYIVHVINQGIEPIVVFRDKNLCIALKSDRCTILSNSKFQTGFLSGDSDHHKRRWY